jgi:hypothetical protein
VRVCVVFRRVFERVDLSSQDQLGRIRYDLQKKTRRRNRRKVFTAKRKACYPVLLPAFSLENLDS